MPATKKRVSPSVLARSIRADGWLPRLRRTFGKVLAQTARDASKAILEGAGPDDMEAFAAGWESNLYNAKAEYFPAMTADGYDLAEGRTQGKAWLPTKVITVAALHRQLGHLIQTRMEVEVEPYLAMTSAVETDTTIARYSRLIKTNITGGMTVQELARSVLAVGLAQSRTRAELMARSGSIWAYNRGAKMRYRDGGFQTLDWIVTFDELLCDWCDQMAARSPIRIDEPFATEGETLYGRSAAEGRVTPQLDIPWDIEHPPLHPHCRCAIAVSVADYV